MIFRPSSSCLVAAMFSEDVVLGALKAGPSWFISDHLLRMDSTGGTPEEVAAEIATGTIFDAREPSKRAVRI